MRRFEHRIKTPSRQKIIIEYTLFECNLKHSFRGIFVRDAFIGFIYLIEKNIEFKQFL